jgi:hypothetical protein
MRRRARDTQSAAGGCASPFAVVVEAQKVGFGDDEKGEPWVARLLARGRGKAERASLLCSARSQGVGAASTAPRSRCHGMAYPVPSRCGDCCGGGCVPSTAVNADSGSHPPRQGDEETFGFCWLRATFRTIPRDGPEPSDYGSGRTRDDKVQVILPLQHGK